ncbi:MAG: protein-disulfide reductase DsbD [Campylobacterales bacterium]|nr:protein-disulfide reductase DsbD [Campylobacterales bacterium]
MVNMIKKLLLVSVIFNTFLFGGFGSSLAQQSFLKPEDAFKVSSVKKEDRIETDLVITENIHVYKDSLTFSIISPTSLKLEVKKPQGKMLDGDEVYENTVHFSIPVSQIESKVKGDYTLELRFEGCSDKGICYQPQTRSFMFEGKQPGFFDKISSLTKEGNTAKIADVLGSESSWFVIVLFFIFGLLLALTPCVFPMIPILSSIIVSQSGDEKPSVAKAFFTSFVYVVSMALTYTVVGIVAGLLGADIQTAMQNPWVLILFAGMFAALALSLFGYYEIGLPASWQSKISKASDDAAKSKGLLGTAVMGLLSALIVGPCVAPPLGGAVLFISHTGDAWLGGLALFVMSMGMGMPLLLVGLGAGKFMPRPGGWMTRVSQVFGVVMLALAIFMLGRILPQSITMLLWAVLFIGSALYMGVFESKEDEGAKKLFKLLAMLFLLYGASLFIGALSGATSLFHPFEKFTTGERTATVKVSQDTNTRLGYSVERLMEEVRASSKPVVVDFGKDSCTACAELEHITFPDPKVQEQLKKFTFIQIDLTKNTEDDKALLEKFELFGTPNIIFFDKEHNFLPQKSLTGFIKPEDFAKHLEEIVR